MTDIIIIAIIAVVFFIGLRATKKHMKGEGSCCGGGSSLPRQNKKLNHVAGKKIVVIEGMTCEHCQNRVERAINEIAGASAKVNLRKKEAIVSYENEIQEEEIRQVVEKAGYTVVEIY